MQKYYWMSAVRLTYVDNEGNTGVTDVNVIVSDEGSKVTMKQLLKIQQGAQITLFNKLNEQVTILGLTVMSIFPLGYMTEEEFSAGAQEMAGAPVVAND